MLCVEELVLSGWRERERCSGLHVRCKWARRTRAGVLGSRAPHGLARTFCGSGARALVGVLSEEFGLNMQNFQVFPETLDAKGPVQS